jgi:hypothetical protein
MVGCPADEINRPPHDLASAAFHPAPDSGTSLPDRQKLSLHDALGLPDFAGAARMKNEFGGYSGISIVFTPFCGHGRIGTQVAKRNAVS